MHVGIRGPLYADTDVPDTERLGFATVHCADVETAGLPRAIDRIRERLGDTPVYVSVDIDVLDPAHAPGTGTPEAGGLTSRELLTTLRALSDLRVVSADIVEVAPAYDHAELTGIAAAHVGYELLSVMAAGPTKDGPAWQLTPRPSPGSAASRSARSTTCRRPSGTARSGTSARCGS